MDAVLSEDADTLMFGSGLTFRSWSPEPSVKTKSPTHVNVYNAHETKTRAGLDRQGMILVAMMSGGDYVPEGIPGIGQKTACEAARARFGEDLCCIKKNDKKALGEWKERLIYELRTNTSKFFKQKHKTLEIPNDFPRTDVLRYYTNPVVSSNEKVEQMKRSITWDQEFDIPGLRIFCAEAFDWVCISGAKHFVRNLSRALLVRSLRMRADMPCLDDPYEVATQEAKLIKTIHGRRQHMSTDNMNELRVGFRPLDIVPLDLSAEDPDPDIPIQGIEADEEAAAVAAEDIEGLGDEPATPRKKRKAAPYNPAELVKDWVFETYVQVGVPLKVQDWQETFRNAKKYETMKIQRKRTETETRTKKGRGVVEAGTLDGFTKVTKSGTRASKRKSPAPLSASQPVVLPNMDEMEPVSLTHVARMPPLRLNLAPSNPLQHASGTFRLPPEMPPSSPASEAGAKPDIIELFSSSPPTESVVASKRSFRRATTEPFTIAEDPDDDRTDVAAPSLPSPQHSRSNNKQSAKVLEQSNSRRSSFRRTQTLPEATSSGEHGLPPLAPPKQPPAGPGTDSVVPPQSSYPEGQPESRFRKPPELPSTPEKKDSTQTPRPKRAPKAGLASPSKAIEITSSPATTASGMRQRATPQFFPSSPGERARKQELSPFYANSRPEHGYSDVSKSPALEGNPEMGLEEDKNEVQNEKERSDGFAGMMGVATRRSPRLSRAKALMETDGNGGKGAAREIYGGRRRVLRVRDSLRGAFALDEMGEEVVTPKSLKGSARKGRRWRISEVEVMDLTT